jgi:hypothetical protein
MSAFNDGFTFGWRQGHAYSYLEAERIAQLQQPIHPETNPAALTKLVRVRVLKAFGLAGGKVAEVGSEVELPRFDATSLAAIGKLEILKG